MKKSLLISALFSMPFAAMAASFTPNAGNVGAARALTGGVRGNTGIANAYVQNQRNTYYTVSTPDVDTACRTKIYACLSEYCGDVTVIPGQRESRCATASESELYNYALLCLQKDNSPLMPNFSSNYTGKGLNSASRLCPSYVQQELMSYLSMSSMANQLTKQHSELCLQRRTELEAAMSCYSVALANGNETESKLKNLLTDYCGNGIPGGSAEMVQKFLSAGNMGADVLGWANKIVSMDLSKKASGWENAVAAVLATYTNRMNLACGDNMQVSVVAGGGSGGDDYGALKSVATLATGLLFPVPDAPDESKTPTFSIFHEVKSNHDIYDYPTAKQVVQAGLTNNPLTQNAYLTSATMSAMQDAYVKGAKVMVIRDAARCYTVQVAQLSSKEQAVLGAGLTGCISQ
jgi:hypothetical protein